MIAGKQNRAPRAVVAWFLLVALVQPPVSVSAADPAPFLSLPELLQEVRRANPNLLAARKMMEAAQARIPLSGGLPAPKIGIEFEEIPRGTVQFDKATLMVQLIQSLPFPGKLSLKQKVAVQEAQHAAAQFKQQEWEVVSELKSSYYELFLIDRQMEIQQAKLLWIRQAEASSRARYSTGMASQMDFLRVRSEAMELSNQLVVLGHRRMAMAAHLNHLLNRPTDAEVGRPASVELMPVPSSPEELLAQAQDHQPDLLIFRSSAQRAEAAWRLSKRELLPDLETMLEVRDPAMGPAGPWDLTLALVLPFWFWTKQRYGVKAALYDKESAEAAYQGAQNEIARRIHENWHEAKASYERALLCQKALIPLAKQAVSVSLAAYQAGKGSFLELLDALRMFEERQMTYFEHLVELEQRLILLEQAVGDPLRKEHGA